MIRVGIVGAGVIAAEHARAIAGVSDAKLVLVASPRVAKAQALAGPYGADACTDLEQLIKNVDVVDICSPTHLHAVQALQAVAAGRHVLCEKPIALSVEDGERMVAAAEAAGVILMVGHVLRFWPEYRVVKRLVADGTLGAPRSACAWRLNPPCTYRPWYYVPERSGGVVIDLLIHDLDVYAWLFGRLQTVQAQGHMDSMGNWQHVQTLLGYEGEVMATAESSYMMADAYPATFLLRVDLEHGCLEYSNRARPGATLTVLRSGAPPEHPSVPEEDAICAEVAYFLRCVREDRPPEVTTPRSAVDSLAASLRVLQVLSAPRQTGLAER